MDNELDRGAEFKSSMWRITAGKPLHMKGETAEGTGILKPVSGTVQNMHRTVTYVERYRYTEYTDG